MHGAATLSVAPARRNDRHGDDASALFLGPADGAQELVFVARLPVGEKQIGIRSQRVDDLTAKDAVLAVAELKITVGPERAGGHVCRQSLAKVITPAPETCIDYGDLDAVTADACSLPAIHTESGQNLLAQDSRQSPQRVAARPRRRRRGPAPCAAARKAQITRPSAGPSEGREQAALARCGAWVRLRGRTLGGGREGRWAGGW